LLLAPKKVRFTKTIPEKLRLGKLAERFICHQLQNDDSIKILLENYQIKREKITIGELDCLLLNNSQAIHLEIVYKFYLYDPSVGTNELEHWIGPNRTDSLVKKLDKLKNKQFPLLYNENTKSILKQHDLKSETIEQKVSFKAQLYIPFQTNKVEFKVINKACVKGFYLKKEQLSYFEDCMFYVPIKINWLQDTNPNVLWINYSSFIKILEEQLEKKQSPLCWIQTQNGDISKYFIVWW